MANGGLDTAPGSIYDKKGLKVSFKIIDDWTEGAAALATNNVDVMLTTADVWAKDYAQFQDKGFSARAFFMVDWSRGADGVIGRQGINSIEDLAGKTVAFAPYTPSHFLLWNGLKSSGLTTEQRNEIFTKAVHTKDGIEPATLFAQQKVDAAVAWDPDMSDAVAKRPAPKKIYDTRIANRLIADVLVVSDRFAANSPQTLVKFVEGWLEGVEFIRQQPARAYTLIGTIKDFNIPADLAKTMLEGVRLSDYADNQAFFGAPAPDSDYANIFKMAQEMYRELRLIKRVSDPEGSVDRRYIAAHRGQVLRRLDRGADRVQGAAPRAPRPSPPSAAPSTSRPNSAKMGLDSRAVVDEIGSFMRAYENTVVDIDGNTDSTGSRELNMALSKQRADAVKDYLIEKYGFPAGRMRTAGNGPDKPIDSNATPEGREKNRRTDIKVYPNPATPVMLQDLFTIRKAVSRPRAAGPGLAAWALVVAGLVPADAVARCCRRSRCPSPRAWSAHRPPVDGVRPARQRLPELVAHRAGLLLVRRRRHPAGPADGQLPLAARPRQPGRRAHALHADHRVPARVHRPVRHGRGDEGGVPLVRHVLLPAGVVVEEVNRVDNALLETAYTLGAQAAPRAVAAVPRLVPGDLRLLPHSLRYRLDLRDPGRDGERAQGRGLHGGGGAQGAGFRARVRRHHRHRHRRVPVPLAADLARATGCSPGSAPPRRHPQAGAGHVREGEPMEQ